MNELDIWLDPLEDILNRMRFAPRSEQRKMRKLFDLRREDLTEALYNSFYADGSNRPHCDIGYVDARLVDVMGVPVVKRNGRYYAPRRHK